MFYFGSGVVYIPVGEFHSDNQAVVATLRKGFVAVPNVMSHHRVLFFVCGKFNFPVTASYNPGFANSIADSLSPESFAIFMKLVPKAFFNINTMKTLPTIP